MIQYTDQYLSVSLQKSLKMLEIYFKIANRKNHSEILEFLREEFYKFEPLTLAHPTPGHTEDDENFSISHLEYGATILALEKGTDQLVGVLIAGPVKPGDIENEIESARTTKWFEIARLLAYVEQKAKVHKKFNVFESLHIHVMAVKSSCRGNQIGGKLLEECLKHAKKQRHTLVSIDCTSVQSSRIAERAGMQLISEVTYEEYNKLIMGNFFRIIPPNFGIKTFAMRTST